GVTVPWWWKRMKTDVIHFHFPSPIAELYCLALCARKQPLIVSYHADIIGYKKALFFYAPFVKKFLKRANRIIISSPALLAHSPFLNKFKDKCVVVPFGIELERFRLTEDIKNAAKNLKEKFTKPIILFVGRLVAYKGLNYLIRAMKDIDAVLLIIGKGDQEAILRKLAKDLGISDKVSFIKNVTDEDLPAYYHACDIFVLPSISNKEEFGVVQLEAHACAKPVISTALPTGVPFVNLDGITGLIVSPCSSKELALAINKLLSDDTLRNRLGQQAKNRLEAEFSRQIMTQKVLNVYAEALKERKMKLY
ncbi:MAG: glycosyltransferase, partial [Candidatus Omnitrophica bacterium]|nr:glycosyltransferase [Candidatus Omnitrophota bacterium]